jgi:AcrR family transcriptional regulator
MTIKNERILLAAAQVLSRNPRASLQDIATEAEISRTTVFHRFATREALIEALTIDALARLDSALAAIDVTDHDRPEATVREVVAALIPLGSRTAFLMRESPLHTPEPVSSRLTHTFTALGLYFATCQDRGTLRRDLPAAWLVETLVYVIYAGWDQVELGELGPVQAMRMVSDMWLAGAQARPEHRPAPQKAQPRSPRS